MRKTSSVWFAWLPLVAVGLVDAASAESTYRPAAEGAADESLVNYDYDSGSDSVATDEPLDLGVPCGTKCRKPCCDSCCEPCPVVPNMLGDFLYSVQLVGSPGNGILYDIPNSAARRFKISENDSILPQDRVLFTFNYFDDAFRYTDTVNPTFTRALDYRSYVVGYEKSLWGGAAAVAVRLPFDGNVAYRDRFGTVMANDGGIGNIPLTFKGLLYSNRNYSLGAGLTVSLPTGDDVTFQQFFTVENDATHLLPYVGLAVHPSDRPWFAHAALQMDFDVTANKLVVPNFGSFTIRDQSLLYCDVALGYWLCREARTGNGVAGLIELHYATNVNQARNALQGVAADQLNNPLNSPNILNLTLGTHLQYHLANVRVGYVVPLSDNDDPLRNNRAFDQEFIIQVNRGF